MTIITMKAHPGEDHDFFTACLKCGARAYINLTLITEDQHVVIANREVPCDDCYRTDGTHDPEVEH